MSTKCSIAHGADFHLYSDCFDEAHVFLRLDNAEFEATQGGVTVKVPLHIWEFLRSFPGADLSDAGKTDAEIEREAIEAVDNRLSSAGAAKTTPGQSLIGLGGAFAMDGIDLPRDQQIANHVEHHQRQRSLQQDVLARIESLKQQSR